MELISREKVLALYEREHSHLATNVYEFGEMLKEIPVVEDRKTEWHPYPQEKPVINKKYLVTRNGNIEISNWYNGMFSFGIVTAWAELPKPYEEGAEE